MSEGASFEIKGDSELQANLKAYAENMTAELAEEMMEIAGEIIRRSAIIVPKDTGELASRSFVEMVGDPADETFSAVAGYERNGLNYGSSNPDMRGKFYSVPVHERLNVNHPNGQAKFLETPFKELEPEYLRTLAKAAKKVDAK